MRKRLCQHQSIGNLLLIETSSSVSHDANIVRKTFHVSLCTVAKCLCIGAIECNEFHSGLLNKNCHRLSQRDKKLVCSFLLANTNI